MAIQDLINTAVTDNTQQSTPQSSVSTVAPVAPAPTPAQPPAPAFTVDASRLGTTPRVQEAATNDPMAEFQSFMAGFAPDTTDLTSARSELVDNKADVLRGSSRTERFNQLDDQMGLTSAQQESAELGEEIARLKASFDQAITDEEGRTIAGRFITGRQAQIMKQRATAVGALASIKAAVDGKVTTANQIIKDTIDREFADRQDEIDALNFELEENADAIEARTDQSKEDLKNSLAERTRILEDEKADRQEAMELAQEAIRNGAPSSIAVQMADAANAEEALALGGQWIGKLDRDLKNSQIAKNRTALTEAAETGDTSGFETTAALVRDSIARVLGSPIDPNNPDGGSHEALAEGAGFSGLRRGFNRLVIGDSIDARLGAQLDTIRSNMLMLGSDPGIRDFFGPQMSEADVRMMMASATRLQENNQNPQEIRDEVMRIDNFIGKLDAAIQAQTAGVALNPNVFTAPDGRQVEIVD